jgi:hypothetical protein
MIWHLSVHGILPIDQPADANGIPLSVAPELPLVGRIKRSEPVARLETPIVREVRIFCFDG